MCNISHIDNIKNMETLYKCSDCKNNKKSEEFNKCKFTKHGFQYKCRECEKQYRNNNKEKIIQRNKKYRQNVNKELLSGKRREYYQKIKEKESIRYKKYREENQKLINERARNNYNKQNRHDRYIKNRERDLNQCKIYRKDNIDKYREYQRNWTNNKRATDPHYAIQHRLRNRLLAALREGKGKKQVSFKELIGCSLEELKLHIEKQFTENMSWEEFHKGNIVIDHKKPCCAFDLTKKEEQKACFHYSNLQPLWEEDNYNKIKDDLKQSIRLNNKKIEKENIDF